MKIFDKVFIVIASSILLIIIFGTAIAFVSGNAKPGNNLRHQDPAPVTITNTSSDETSVYTQLGTLRLSTNDEPSIPIVLSPYFPYPSTDKAFYEELFKKNQKMQLLVRNYFEVYTREELLSIGEDEIKANLLSLLNSELVLGKISDIYFADYSFLE